VSDVDPEVLKRTTVFSTCTTSQLARLAAAADLTEHAEGEALLEEGVVGHRFHLLLEGEAAVERHGQHVGTVRQGEFVGEISLLGGGRVSATVRCTKPTRALTLEREPFWRLLEEEPAIALRILELVARRLAEESAATETSNL
jgi:CRP-like cAMP-binding protein